MQARAMLCEFCHRIQQDASGTRPLDRPEDLPLFLQRHGLALQELKLYDGLCAQCEGFYRQLVTYSTPQSVRWTRSAADAHL